MPSFPVIRTVAAAAAMCLSLPALSADPLSYVTSSGRWHDVQRETILNPAEKALGLPVKVIATADRYPPLKTQVASGRVFWDVMEMPSFFCIRGVKDNLWEKLDYSLIPNAEGVPAQLKNDHHIGYITYSNVLAFNSTRFVGKEPKTWADFFNVKDFPGRRSLRNTPRPTLELALLADGVASDKLYPLDVERAYKKLAEIRPHITVWWTSGGQALQLLADGEVDMMGAWNGSVSGAMLEPRTKLKYSFTQGVLEYTCLAVPRGASRPQESMKAVNAFLDPKSLADMAKMTDYGPVNAKAYDLIPADRQEVLPSSPKNLGAQATMSAEWWASPEGVAAEERWLRFMQGR